MVVIEDLISTGKSSLQVVDLLRREKLEVQVMVSIFNYGFDVAEQAFSASKTPFISLTTYKTLIELAEEKGIVVPADQASLLEWRRDPASWKVIS